MPEKKNEKNGKDFNPKDFVKTEDKLKLSLLNMEKRFVDLEFAVSELSSRIEYLDLEELQKEKGKLNDLENMILVEQAGILELKKIMENLDSKFSSSVSKEDVSIIKDRVKKIEALSRAAVQMVDISTDMPEEARLRISKLEDAVAELKSMPSPQSVDSMEIADIKRNINLIDSKLDNVGSRIEEIDMGLKERVKRIINGFGNDSEMPPLDFNLINSRMESLKTMVDTLSNKRVETELKISTMEQKINELKNRGEESVPGMLIEAVKESRKAIEVLKIRNESIERVVKELTKSMKEVELSARRFEGFERLSALQDDVDKKLMQFRFMQEEIKKLSNRIEIVYNDLDGRLDNIKKVERSTKANNEEMRDIREQFDKIKFDIKKSNTIASDVRLLKDNMEELNKTIDRVASLSEKKISARKSSKKDTELVKELEDRISRIENSLNDIKYKIDSNGEKGLTDYESKLGEIIDKLVFLETRLSAVESIFHTSSKTQAVIIE